MKYTFHLLLAALVLHPQYAAGDDIECQAVYGQALSTCARSLDWLTSNPRAGAQKACVDGARLTRAYCMSGINACLDYCQSAYEHSVASCEATFAPAVCTGGATCEAIILQQSDNCISHAVSMLEACSAACPQ
jgi:hypothetical protein